MKEKVVAFIKEISVYIIIVVVIVLLKIYVISPIRVNGTSMNPTLENGDIMILNKIGYHITKIKRFDIVVIKYKDELLIKRVIGLPGEKIKYENNTLYVNDKALDEEFDRTYTYNFSLKEIGSITVPDNSYFVLGDNREVSKDSRSIGFIDREDIVGKSSLTLFPVNRFGMKR